MKHLVVNRYKEVLMVMGNTLQTMQTVGVYPSVQDALDGMGKLFNDTIWQENPEDVKIYGIVTEDNGYKHTDKCPLFTSNTRQFWGGKRPSIKEVLR